MRKPERGSNLLCCSLIIQQIISFATFGKQIPDVYFLIIVTFNTLLFLCILGNEAADVATMTVNESSTIAFIRKALR